MPPVQDLATAHTVYALDGLVSGNFMIRGFGTNLTQATPVPTPSRRGLVPSRRPGRRRRCISLAVYSLARTSHFTRFRDDDCETQVSAGVVGNRVTTA